ncbi:uncharacterized protein LOC123229722 [Mangifera indica]|uniref:uncharacterized protein LOC123229722 n=1 Tax=Mangifera indica TaxID=29780 RepID=UPI001CF965F1|nr:uncharacterized protein LOC123229722 [Mangifera indica]
MASSSNSSLLAIPVFNGVHYHIWVVKMKIFLQAADLWDVVETDGNFPTMPENPTIVHCTTAKQVWEKLQQEYQGSEKTRTMKIITLKRLLENTRMNDTESVSQYSDRIMKLVNEMRILGEDLSEERIVEKVLVSLLEKFESKISSLKDSRDITSIFLTDLMSALEVQEQRRKMRSENGIEMAFQTKATFKPKFTKEGKKPYFSKGKNKKLEGFKCSNNKERSLLSCSHCKRNNHKEDECWFKGKVPPPLRCRFCNKNGHIEKFCYRKQEQQNPEPLVQQNQQLNVAEEEKK